jgi:hypothetical protein
MNLGDPTDWATFAGLLIAASTIVIAVWRLARAASRLEVSISQLTKAQEILGEQIKTHILAFQQYQHEQAHVIADLQLAVEHLTWEIQALKGDEN